MFRGRYHIYRRTIAIVLIFVSATAYSAKERCEDDEWDAIQEALEDSTDNSHAQGGQIKKGMSRARERRHVIEVALAAVETLNGPVKPELLEAVTGVSHAYCFGRPGTQTRPPETGLFTQESFLRRIHRAVKSRQTQLQAEAPSENRDRRLRMLEEAKISEKIAPLQKAPEEGLEPTKYVRRLSALEKKLYDEWIAIRPSAQHNVMGKLVSFMGANGRLPNSKKEFSEIVGMSYSKVVGLDSYITGGVLEAYALHKNPADFREALVFSRTAEVERLSQKQKAEGLTEAEALELANLNKVKFIDSRDGVIERKEREIVVRARNWDVERPIAQRDSADRTVDFIAEHGRLPQKNEIKDITKFGYEKLTGGTKYAPTQDSAHLAVYRDREAFRSAWNATREAEISRLEAKRLAEGLSPAELQRLQNLRAVTPTQMPDGIAPVLSRIPPFVTDSQTRFQRKQNDQVSATDSLVEYLATKGVMPEGDEELSVITGIGADRLLGLGRWGPGKRREKFAVFSSPQEFRNSWMRARVKAIFELEGKVKDRTIDNDGRERLRNLRRLEPLQTPTGVVRQVKP